MVVTTVSNSLCPSATVVADICNAKAVERVQLYRTQQSAVRASVTKHL